MKKSLLALAVLGAFSGAAFAQSNVTLYGIVDVNYQYNNPAGSTACYNEGTRLSSTTGVAVAAASGGSLASISTSCSTTSGINGGHQSGNRWGIRGSEDLGGGMAAIFTLESGFAIDTGASAQGGKLFGRQAWAGIQGNWGAVVAGRIAALSSGTGSFDMWGAVDPFLTGFGDSGLQNTFSSSNALRLDNAVAYVSPTWSGFKVGAAYSFNVLGSENPGNGNNTRAFDFGLNWTWGNLFLATTYDQIYLPNCTGTQTPNTALCGGANQSHWQIGGTYDFKLVKLHAAYAMEKNQRVAAVNGTLPNQQDGFDANAWMVGVTVPLFGGQILASYQNRDGDAQTLTANPAQKYEGDLSIWAIAYTYPLSRRTNLYVNWSDKTGKKSLADTTALTSAASTGGLVGGLGGDRTQFTVGMRHLF